MTVTRDWYLEVNGVPLATYAWEIPNLDEIFRQPDLRGTDVIIPGEPGFISNPTRPTGTVYGPFPLDIFGEFTPDGTPISDPLEGMVEHRDYLADNLGFGGPVVDIIFHRGTLGPRTGEGHFLGLQGWSTDAVRVGYARTTFDLLIPAGELVGTGS